MKEYFEYAMCRFIASVVTRSPGALCRAGFCFWMSEFFFMKVQLLWLLHSIGPHLNIVWIYTIPRYIDTYIRSISYYVKRLLNWENNGFPFLFTWGGVLILKFCGFFKVLIMVAKKAFFFIFDLKYMSYLVYIWNKIFFVFKNYLVLLWSIGHIWYRFQTIFFVQV